jgi:hypothetical protein
MAAVHGSKADLVGNGYVISDFLNSVSFGGSRDAAEDTTFKDTSKTYVPGLKDQAFSCEGIWDGDVDAADAILHAAFASDVDGLFSYFPMGQETIGNPAYTMDAIESSYEITTDVGDVAQISAEIQSGTQGRFTRGKVARAMAVAAAGGNTTGMDWTAASTAGGSLTVHATASSTLNVKLQDSADNATFADVAGGSLTFVTGRGSQRLVFSGTIRRYTRVLWTGTGTFLAVVDRY